MLSSNGKIPAGSVNFNIAQFKLGNVENGITSIDKCPDKSASI